MVAALLLAPAAPAHAACPTDRLDRRARIAHVHDGDTVRLEDGRKVRLIAVNAPEAGRDGQPAQPFADEATRALTALLPAGAAVSLRLGREREDRYGRLLAHLFTRDGVNVQAELIAQGMAVAITVPPNDWAAACYWSLDARARAARTGVWSSPRFAAVEAGALERTARGFRIVAGTVTRIGRSRDNLWLNLGRGVALRIPLADLHWFEGRDPAGLLEARVESRGWLQQRRGELRMTVRHPRMLAVITRDQGTGGREP